jgi:hypothetical protein
MVEAIVEPVKTKPRYRHCLDSENTALAVAVEVVTGE